MAKRVETATETHPKTLLIAVHTPYNPVRNVSEYFAEFVHLVESNGIAFDGIEEVRLRSIDGATFFTKGKLEDIIARCDSEEFEEVIISETLTVQQERNLNKLTRCRVFDRTNLILEIFEKRATSAEGKIQVQLAMLQHKKARLAGRGISMSQQAGRIGTRGPGETQKEKDMQHVEHLMLRLRRELERLERVRSTQRKQRLTSRIPLFCLIGYTNAGKSSLLNALTHSSIVAENQLFSTLDTTTRELYINKKKLGLLSDTVGFIQDLPPNLIEAFKSTLAELSYAHLLLHVVDCSNPNWKTHIMTVESILEDLGLTDQPLVYLFNKADRLTDDEKLKLVPELPIDHRIIFTSTVTPDGLNELRTYLATWTEEHQPQEAVSHEKSDS